MEGGSPLGMPFFGRYSRLDLQGQWLPWSGAYGQSFAAYTAISVLFATLLWDISVCVCVSVCHLVPFHRMRFEPSPHPRNTLNNHTSFSCGQVVVWLTVPGPQPYSKYCAPSRRTTPNIEPGWIPRADE